jgi:hypothetical protein
LLNFLLLGQCCYNVITYFFQKVEIFYAFPGLLKHAKEKKNETTNSENSGHFYQRLKHPPTPLLTEHFWSRKATYPKPHGALTTLLNKSRVIPDWY